MIRKTITALALTIGVGITALPADAHPNHREWNRCHLEDGSGQKQCIWDGRHMGNGEGRSYKVFRWGDDLRNERFVYISHRKAHHLIHAH